MLLTMSTTTAFHLKISFVVVATAIADIVVDKFNFVMTSMCFIFAHTRCTTSKFEKTLKTKNKRSTESLNENCIHQFDSYEVVESSNSLFHDHDRAILQNAYIDFDKKNTCHFFLAFARNLFSLRKIFSFYWNPVYDLQSTFIKFFFVYSSRWGNRWTS